MDSLSSLRKLMRHSAAALLIIVLAFQSGCKEPEGNGALTVGKSGSQLVNDIGIASFAMPDGWMSNRSNGNSVAVLTRKEANPAALEEMISIDAGKPASIDVKNSADALANKFGGSASKLPYQRHLKAQARFTSTPAKNVTRSLRLQCRC